MKKIVSICLVALLAFPTIATAKTTDEERAARDYSQWLPAAGDFSIGFSIDPLASFIGNAFNGTVNNSLKPLHGQTLGLPTNQVAIMGKYMLTDQLGLRFNAGFNFGYDRTRFYAVDDKALLDNPLSGAKVIDGRKDISNGGSIAIGVDYHVGKKAVQGIFGGGILYGFDVQRTRYSYGNAITEANQCPTLGDAELEYTSVDYLQNARPLSTYNNEPTHTVGLYGIVGIEWFVAPKIALGANVNLKLLYNVESQIFTKYEGWNSQTNALDTYVHLEAPGNDGFHFGVDNIGANLYVAFYF